MYSCYIIILTQFAIIKYKIPTILSCFCSPDSLLLAYNGEFSPVTFSHDPWRSYVIRLIKSRSLWTKSFTIDNGKLYIKVDKTQSDTLGWKQQYSRRLVWRNSFASKQISTRCPWMGNPKPRTIWVPWIFFWNTYWANAAILYPLSIFDFPAATAAVSKKLSGWKACFSSFK